MCFCGPSSSGLDCLQPLAPRCRLLGVSYYNFFYYLFLYFLNAFWIFKATFHTFSDFFHSSAICYDWKFCAQLTKIRKEKWTFQQSLDIARRIELCMMKRGRKTWTHQQLSAGTMARTQTWPLSEARPWVEDFYSQMTQSTIRRARGQCARNLSSFVLWRVECLFFCERIKIFTAYGSKTKHQHHDAVCDFSAVLFPLLVKLDTFLLLDSLQCGSCGLTRCFLDTFFFPCGVRSCSSHTSPHTWNCGHLESVKTAGSRPPCHHLTGRANLHRVSWWRLQSDVMWLSRRAPHEVCHWGHKHPFDQSATQIEARFHDKWIKWN